MSALAYTTAENAVLEIKNRFVALVNADDYSIVAREEPDLFLPKPGKPALTVLYAGAENDGQGYENATVPPILLFQVRVYHQLEPWQSGQDPFQNAQLICIRGDSKFQAALMLNRTLDDNVVNCRVESVQVGELADREGNPFWGHELFVSVEVH